MRRLLSSILFLQAFFLSLAFTAKAQQPRLIIPMGQRNGYYNVSLSPDGKHALTAGGRTAIIWEIGSGAVAAELSRPDLDIREAFYSPDGQRVLTTGSETAALWDAATGQLVTELKGMNKAIVDQHFSPDGSSILIVCTDETARLYSARTGQLQKLLHIPPSPTARQQLGDLAVVRLQNAAFSPDGKKIAFNRSDDLTAVIDLTTGKIVRNIPSSLQDSDEDDEHFEGFCTVEYSPDGRQVVTGSYNGSLSIWNASTGRLLRRWKAHPAAIFLAHYSPDGTRLITKDLDNRAALWQSSTGALLTDLKSETALGFLCFNRDGTRIATGYDGGLLYLRDAQGQPLKKMQTGATGIPSLAFSNNGQQIAVAAFDRTTRIFRIADGRQLAELKGHADVLRGLALSPDGKTIWSFTGAISYNWNMATGRLIGVSPITGIVQRYCWDPTGERLLTRESFATPAPVKIWDTRTGQELFALQAPPRALRPAGPCDRAIQSGRNKGPDHLFGQHRKDLGCRNGPMPYRHRQPGRPFDGGHLQPRRDDHRHRQLRQHGKGLGCFFREAPTRPPFRGWRGQENSVQPRRGSINGHRRRRGIHLE